MPTFRYTVVDVFTDTPLSGNQLAVFTDARGLDGEMMQALAREVNLSESTFLFPPEQGGTASVRIFTPVSELPFAGHPTLGTAWVLGAPLQLGVISLETAAGTVPVELERDELGKIVFGRMSQPVPGVEPFPDPEALVRALGVARSELPVEIYDNGARHTFVALPTEEDVAAVKPDLAALGEWDLTGVTCAAGAGSRWKMRMFGPRINVPEDPATGSAAGPLACHLARHGLIEWGTEIEIAQGVEIGRPSTLYARAEGGGGLIDRVEVGGSAVVVARGEFRL